MENYIGRLLDSRYEILEVIGTGGMAVVYKALDHRLNRLVAVKILKDELSRNQEFRRRFDGCQVDRVLTIEASGIAVAAFTAQAFDQAPVLFAKKHKTKNIAGDVFLSQVESFTQDKRPYNIFVSKEFLHPGERVLLIDDFLANGSALEGLIDLVHQAGAQVVGAGIVIEKAFQPGHQRLLDKGYRLEALASVASLADGKIRFTDAADKD